MTRKQKQFSVFRIVVWILMPVVVTFCYFMMQWQVVGYGATTQGQLVAGYKNGAVGIYDSGGVLESQFSLHDSMDVKNSYQLRVQGNLIEVIPNRSEMRYRLDTQGTVRGQDPLTDDAQTDTDFQMQSPLAVNAQSSLHYSKRFGIEHLYLQVGEQTQTLYQASMEAVYLGLLELLLLSAMVCWIVLGLVKTRVYGAKRKEREREV